MSGTSHYGDTIDTQRSRVRLESSNKKPVSDWLKMLPYRTTGLNNVRVFSIGHK